MMNSFLRSSQFSLRFTQRLKSLALALLCACALCFQFTASARLSADSLLTQESNQLEFFEKQVRPILARNCQSCHNATAKVAGLDLTSAEAFARGGDSGPVFSKANPEESRLLKAISYQETLKMPPVGRLKDEEIAALTVWVKMGAPWPAASLTEATDAKRTNKTTVRAFTAAEKAFWSFQPMQRPSAPRVKNSAWVSSPLDAFILQKLEEKNLRPAPPADKLTLLRRATFDLAGLPPTEKEIREFLADNSSEAFKKVIERLLSSPRYGERWGRHWLDVARYADSTGNDEDHRYPHAWKYRDYVIESFNRDLPYDQFVREQLAGDLLPAKDSSGVNRRGIIATGFLALGPKAVAQQDKKKMLYDVYDEQVDVTTKAFLGLTLSCARCHNHKFDPLLTRDYYSMLGIFASTRSFTDPDSHVSVVLEKPLVSKTEWEQYQAGRKEHQAKEKRARLAIEEITDSVREPAARQRAARLADFMLAARMVYHDGKPLAEIARQMNLSEELLKKWVEYLKPQELTPQHLLEWRNAPADKLAEAAKNYQQRFDHRLTAWLEAVSKWRAEYQKAISDRNSSLPDKPKFEPGEDRFFDDVYFNRSGPLAVSEKDQAQFSPEHWRQLTQLQQELEQLKKSAPAEPELACAIEEGEMVAQKVFIRGDYNNPGEDAPPGFPAILARDDHKPAFTGNGRLQLAEWLTQAEHPLTARVMANRIWQWHFGEGLVRTPDNFGRMGERPTHPELLDYLARAFISSGWSVKAMHRMIMLSSAYQMSSVNPQLSSDADPDNRLLTRFNRRRLSVEEMRDGLLSLDGALDLTMGGTLQQGRGTDGENNQGRLSLNPEKLNRRTVYLPLRRANLPTLLNLFDFGDATSATGKRQLTNVATQALFWLNSHFLTEHSGNLAKQLATQPTLTEAARIERAYLRILNRQPDKNEITQAQQYVAGFRGKFAGENSEQRAWQSFCRALMASNDFIYVD